MTPPVVVSRHPATVAFITQPPYGPVKFSSTDVPVLSEDTPDDVRGAHVAGNLPPHLAAPAATVTAVEFSGPPPRGTEYTLADMLAAGARLARYRVVRLGEA